MRRRILLDPVGPFLNKASFPSFYNPLNKFIETCKRVHYPLENPCKSGGVQLAQGSKEEMVDQQAPGL